MSITELFLFALSVVVAGAVAGIVFLYKSELDRAYRAARRGSLIAGTKAGPIEYADNGSGPPLLSIHGAGGGFDQGVANAADIVGEGFRIIAPSRFGYLRTPIPQDGSAAAQADAHAALLSYLNVSKAAVIGASAGARSAIELALRHPDRVTALVLISPSTYAPSRPVAVETSRGSRLVFWLVNRGADFVWWAAETIAPSLLVRFIGIRPELFAASPKAEQARVMNIIRNIKPLSLRFRGINVDSHTELHQLPLEKIAAPTLIVAARDDGFNTLPAAEFAASKIPYAELVIYEAGGHLLIGHEGELRMMVRSFLGLRDKAMAVL
ncbi:MAG TPA: alpha/beta hydrolase [Bradyrhizobium sp.]|nr:alpha/beta hydrolase [Bradyrhizobium sp.]